MSIPFFFTPKTIEDLNVFDGGARNNFPLKIFTESYPNNQVIALYLKTSEKSGKLTLEQKGKKILFGLGKLIIPGLRRTTSIAGDLVDIVTDGEEKQIVEQNFHRVVIIDPSPIQTTDFNLTDLKKELLILSGRLGALKFIEDNHKDIKTNKKQIAEIDNRISEIKKSL